MCSLSSTWKKPDILWSLLKGSLFNLILCLEACLPKVVTKEHLKSVRIRCLALIGHVLSGFWFYEFILTDSIPDSDRHIWEVINFYVWEALCSQWTSSYPLHCTSTPRNPKLKLHSRSCFSQERRWQVHLGDKLGLEA